MEDKEWSGIETQKKRNIILALPTEHGRTSREGRDELLRMEDLKELKEP
jgi:hypothetical protein